MTPFAWPPQCAKCRCIDATVQYRAPAAEGTYRCVPDLQAESLVCACKRCAYVWYMQPADAARRPT